MRRGFAFRFLEIVPGAALWAFFITAIILSIFYPFAFALYILLFDLYWIIKVFVMGAHMIWGYRLLNWTRRQNWRARLEKIEPGEGIIDWREIYHVVILTTYQEPLEILRPSVAAAAQADYPRAKKIFVLATEERDKEDARQNAVALRGEFAHHFEHFLVTEHPDGIEGELKAKGANATWAARELKVLLEREKIPLDRTLVTTADADTRLDRQYFTVLSYVFATDHNRERHSYQPIALYSNNIWDVPAISRLSALGASFWQIIEGTRPWRLITFSTHAMTMQMLVDIDYWAVDIVNEDSRQFYRAFFHYDGDHSVVPVFIPVYMDAVLAPRYAQTLKNQYLQKRRWAYGIEHFPYVVLESIRNKRIPLMNRITIPFRIFEGNFSWASSSVILLFLGWFPFLFGGAYRETVLASNIPLLSQRLLAFTWISLTVTIVISSRLIPERPLHHRKSKWIEMILQWTLTPVTAVIFGSIPAIDAQTRLMFGRYMGFWVTPKVSAKSK